MFLTEQLLRFIPQVDPEFFRSLSVAGRLVVEINLWLLAVGLASLAIVLILHLARIGRIDLIRRGIQKHDWKSTPPAEREAHMLQLTRPNALLHWAVSQLIRLKEHSAPRLIDEIVDLAAARLRPIGFLNLLPRLAILLGLLGTLLGLVQAVSNAFMKISVLQANPEAFREPLSATLQGLGVAFTTTMSGVIAAIVLTPLLLLARHTHHRLQSAIDGALTLDILPVLAPDREDASMDLRAMIEEVTRQALASLVPGLVQNTLREIGDLANAMRQTVAGASRERADIICVVNNLDQATSGIRAITESSGRLIGQLDSRIRELGDTVARLTPESEIRREAVETLGRVLREELATQWGYLRHKIDEQMEKMDQVARAIDMMGLSLGNASNSMSVEMKPLGELVETLSTQMTGVLNQLQVTVDSILRILNELTTDSSALQALSRPEWVGSHLEPIGARLDEIGRMLESSRAGAPRRTAAGIAPVLNGETGAHPSSVRGRGPVTMDRIEYLLGQVLHQLERLNHRWRLSRLPLLRRWLRSGDGDAD